MQPQNSRWSFTSWDKPVCSKQELIQFEVYQREFTDNHTDSKIHYQGYVEFFRPYSQAQVKRLYKDKKMHLEQARSSRERNIMYCTKPDSNYGYRYMYNGPHDFYESSNILLNIL